METFITVLHIAVCFFLILVVLVQGGNQGGVGAAFGGGNSQGVFGATGATSLLGKMTHAAAAVFLFTTISLTILQGQPGSANLGKRLSEPSKTELLKETPAAKEEKKK